MIALIFISGCAAFALLGILTVIGSERSRRQREAREAEQAERCAASDRIMAEHLERLAKRNDPLQRHGGQS